ncbi:molybdopterin-dependent oxidoreductase [Paracoccus laeviglucosivorans]|uniref:Oxidoreductase molybdopterin-binding domain-containing protein n=1 Tax=Paracoccus laeviglucosivorans TaxID=1197861 RepID=A0A521FMZ8_9RHOB|nr:molybdopterin-dependent oxidoreductase [Paracoccus laeviglucosivorans]SMO96841.1 hypothetical protein SAMN06265221_12538 [Paracoccus laeviglucosivorans]
MIRSCAVLLAAVCFTNASWADALPKPTGPVILTITGNIENTNDGDIAQFDRAMLEGLGLKEIKTNTPWYNTLSTFEGVPFNEVMKYVGANGETVRAIALNDYETEIPMSDAVGPDAILAMKLNGQYMDVRDKGPIFVVYPYDSSQTYQTQTYYSRSAWQVTRFIVE